MRLWTPSEALPQAGSHDLLSPVVDAMASPDFAVTLLASLRTVLPGTSLSVYRTGPGSRPRRYLGVSHRRPDTTRDCWRAYMSGPYMRDQTLMPSATALPKTPLVFHVSADEVPAEHRAKVYEAHGMAERVSVVQQEAGQSVFAVNLYRHIDSPAFRDSQIAEFAAVAPLALSITRKHIALLGLLQAEQTADNRLRPRAGMRERLLALHAQLTRRELDVCERLLRGMTDEGIAADLTLGLPTVRTYRNRAFARLGIHFRSELFALMQAQADS